MVIVLADYLPPWRFTHDADVVFLDERERERELNGERFNNRRLEEYYEANSFVLPSLALRGVCWFCDRLTVIIALCPTVRPTVSF